MILVVGLWGRGRPFWDGGGHRTVKDGKISKMQTKPDQVDPASPGQKGFSEPVETLFFSKHFFKKKTNRNRLAAATESRLQ